MSKKGSFSYNHFSDHVHYQIVTESAASISSAREEARYRIPGTQFPKKSLKVSYVQCWTELLFCECFQAEACLDVKVPMFQYPIMHYVSGLQFKSRGDVLYYILHIKSVF